MENNPIIIGQRLAEGIKKSGKTQKEVAQSVGITENGLLNYLKDRQQPSSLILHKICQEIGITMDSLFESRAKEPNLDKQSAFFPQVVTVDQVGRDNVVLVDAKAAAGYLSGFGDSVYFTKLPSFRLPMLNGGLYRMFEVSGESMWPNLTSGDYVVAEFVENWQDMPTRQVYVVICVEQGVIVKRVSNLIKDVGKILCQSDNPDRENYKPIELLLPEIKEIWRVRYKISASIDLQNTYTAELGRAWSEIQQVKVVNKELGLLKDRLSKIESGLNEVQEDRKKFSN